MRFVVILVIIYILGIVLYLLYTTQLNYKYKLLDNTIEVNDTIESIIYDARASARIKFKNGERFTIPWAKVGEGLEEINLPNILAPGDILTKKLNSDTVVLIKKNKARIFVLYKSIQSE